MKIKSLICLFFLAVIAFTSCKKEAPDAAFPMTPDKIIVGTGGNEKEILPDDGAFDEIISKIKERVKKSAGFSTAALAAYDPETGKHLSYGQRESETFVEFIYDECKTQEIDMLKPGPEAASRDIDVHCIFFPLTGECHGEFFVGDDLYYKSAATLGILADSTELITYVNSLVKE